MNIVTLDHITKSYTGRLLFSDASFYLQEGEKVGIIGINGTGKSTLLRILGGLEEPDAGEVILAKNRTVQLLSQQPEFEPQDTVLQAALRSHTRQSTQEQQALAAQAKTMLTELSVTAYDTPVAELSGGQRKRGHLSMCCCINRTSCFWMSRPTIWMRKWHSGWKIS